MNIRIILAVALNLIFTITLSAKTQAVNASSANRPKPLSFIENKGQITDKKGNCRNDIDVKLETGTGLTIFVGDGEVHYQWAKTLKRNLPDDPMQQSIDSNRQTATYRMDVVLVGANKTAEIITSQQQSYYESYYLPQCPNGAVAHSYNKITYKNIYPNIDWVLYSKGNELKYDFIVHAGGNYRDIKLKYQGATAMSIKDGALTAATPFGIITEHKPYCYDAITKKEVLSSYRLQGDLLSFNVDADDRTIVIDPLLIWGTYYGGDKFDEITGIATDSSKRVYITGGTWSDNIVTTSGLHQDTFAGQSDGFIAQFDEAGQRLWSTYYGGTNPDGITDIISDAGDNLFVTGWTSSYSGIATPASHKQYRDGGSISAFLARFDNTGQLVWGTYYGSGDCEKKQQLALSVDNHIYLVGTIVGDSVATQDGYQEERGGNEDAFLAKFDYSGNRVWGTFWGTADYEYGQGVACDPAGNVFITGQTNTANMVTTLGCHQAAKGGVSDAFAVKFDSSGKLIWSTYYGGAGDELANGIHVDNSGNLYFYGITGSFDAIATPGSFQPVKAGSTGYFTKFSNDGKQLWGTYFANRVTGLVSDGQRDVYVAGSADVSNTNVATPDGYKTTFGGGYYDAYLARFTLDGQRVWATLYGGSENDLVEDIASDEYGNIYIAGYTYSTDSIATPNAFQQVKGADADGFFMRFLETAAFIDPALRDTLFCIGNTLDVPVKVYNTFNAGNVFTVQLSDASGSFTNPVNIGSIAATKSAMVTASIPANTPLSPRYRIRVIASSPVDTSNDNGFDIRIGANPVIAASSNSPVCEDKALRITVNSNDPNVVYNWIGPVYVSAFQNVNFEKAALSHAGKHIVSVTSKGCISRDTVEVVVNPKPNFINTAVDETVCKGDSLNLSVETTLQNAAVNWSSTTGYASNLASNIIYPATVANSGIYSVYAISTEACSSDTLKKEVNVIDLKAKATTNAQLLYYGDTLQFSTTDNPAGTQYAWSGPGGFMSDKQHPQVADVTSKQQGDYYITVSLSGCSVKDKVYLQVLAAKRFNLFPNPNNGNFTITGRITKDQEIPIEIINYMGQVVYRDHTKTVNYRFEKTISLEGGFNSGFYFVRLGIDGKTEDLRFILAR